MEPLEAPIGIAQEFETWPLASVGCGVKHDGILSVTIGTHPQFITSVHVNKANLLKSAPYKAN